MDINQFKSLVMKYKVHVLIGIGALILIVMGYSQFGASDMNSQESMKPINEQPQPILGDKTYDTKKHSKVGETKSKDKRLMVDIKGAVRSPNVYEMKENDRIKQLLDRAGVLPEADLSQINLSERLQDQKLIYIPSKYDEGPKPNGVHTTSMEPTSSTSNNSGEVSVNLNQATEQDITKVPGIGPQKAKAIIDYRNEKGAFQSVEELKEVKGIGEKTFEKLKDYFTI